jgi:hypothetical protein
MKAFYTRLFNPLIILLLTFVLMDAAGCSKYPDGPALSLLPKKWRLDENWKKTKVIRNGTDVTTQALANTQSESFKINRDGSFSYSTSFNSGGSYDYSGTWSFSTDKTVLYFSYVFGNSYANDVFLILRLKEDDMWLRSIDQAGDVYEYHYIPN